MYNVTNLKDILQMVSKDNKICKNSIVKIYILGVLEFSKSKNVQYEDFLYLQKMVNFNSEQ